MSPSPARRRLGALLAAAALAGCASPGERMDRAAARHGFARMVVAGDRYTHVVYRRGRIDRSVHVYIEHDGRPFHTPDEVNDDPTPREPLALDLMARDPAPSILLGRPCYGGLAREPPCAPAAWTDARYGEAVVASMAAALGRMLSIGATEVILIGASGGGTLAVLLAERLPNVRAVVGIAPNLDLDAWVRLHDYSPLAGSIDPARRPPRCAPPEVHYAGARDANVPPALVHGYARSRPAVQVIEVAGYDHRCCWSVHWPARLADALARAAAVHAC